MTAAASDGLEAVRRAAEELERAEQITRNARRALHEEMVRAHDAGRSLSAIARAAGVSRPHAARLLSG